MKQYLSMLLWLTLLSAKVFSQQQFRIVTEQASIQYLKNVPGSASSVTRSTKIRIEYWTTPGVVNANQIITIGMLSAVAAPASMPVITTVPYVIPKDSFSAERKIITFTVYININKVTSYAPEFFSIGLMNGAAVLDASQGGALGISIMEMPVEDKNKDEPLETPYGFSYLNAINFDFANSSGAAYVGHLNLFRTDILPSKKNGHKYFGINCGIMKINYSKGGDSINTSYDFTENTKVNPLDVVKMGMPFNRQFNNLKTVSKNTSMSFYFQPTYTIRNDENLKILAHIHTEFFVNTWKTLTTITKIQEVRDTVKSWNDTSSIIRLDRFYKESSASVSSESSTTKLIFFVGVGITVRTRLWKGGNLFVQPTVGLATAYLSPEKLASEQFNKVPDQEKTDKIRRWFHLSRFEFEQQLSGSFKVVMGLNVRGRFQENPAYAAYIGANVGLDGIKGLFK